MIKGVSHQLFLEFVKSVKSTLETQEGNEPAAPPPQRDSVPLITIVLKTIWAAIVGPLRRLFGGRKSAEGGTK
jgi:hypothetical protein